MGKIAIPAATDGKRKKKKVLTLKDLLGREAVNKYITHGKVK